MATLKFETFTSVPDISFWQRLARLKIDELGLDEAPVPISGTFALQRSTQLLAIARVSEGSFAAFERNEEAGDGGGTCGESSKEAAAATAAEDAPAAKSATEWRMPGTLINLNTVESFKTINKAFHEILIFIFMK